MANTSDNSFRDQMVALLPRMRRFAFILTSNREDADDLVQTACERALSRRHQWRPGSRLDSWIFRIIYTQRIEMTRSQWSRNVHIPIEEGVLGPSAAETKINMESIIMLRRVFQAMGHLSEIDRVVIALVCIEGLSYKDSAATLNVPVGTVMSRLARARRRLHEMVYSSGGRPSNSNPKKGIT